MISRFRFASTACLLGILTMASPARAADCAAIVEAAAAANTVAALEPLAAEAGGACPQAQFDWVEDRLGRAHYRAAGQAKDIAARRHHLDRAAATLRADRWRAQMALGDMAHTTGDHAAASDLYQRALLSIEEHPDAQVPEATVRKLISRANAARALSPRYTRALRTRSGTPGGIAARSIGGVVIEEVPFPVEFEYDSHIPTEDGILAIEDLFGILRDNGLRRVLLVGHTDPAGSDSYNMALSERRAQTVGAILLELGLDAEIRIRPAGEREPPEIDDPDLYTEAERHQIMRRVVLDLSGSGR